MAGIIYYVIILWDGADNMQMSSSDFNNNTHKAFEICRNEVIEITHYNRFRGALIGPKEYAEFKKFKAAQANNK